MQQKQAQEEFMDAGGHSAVWREEKSHKIQEEVAVKGNGSSKR